MATVGDPVALAEAHWGLQFKKKTTREWCAPCPKCGGVDRFLLFADGGFWCRQCGYRGWIDALDGARQPSREEILEARIRRLERLAEEHERRLSALEKMHRCQDHLRYHQLLTDQALEYWLGEGITQDSINRYLLGYCPRCPTDKEHRPSYTIPVINDGLLWNIRHRLVNASNGDKYRPHMAGLGNQLFNADFLKSATEIVVVEGAKKSIVLDQNGLPSVAIMGQRAFKREWLESFAPLQTVYIALDPDAAESARRLGKVFGEKARIMNLPVKPDDFFFRYGGTVDDFAAFMKIARRVAT